ncbi:MAG: hypothetical protein WC348_01815 [Patescibacteria group bacterium]|jgi:hypothetical protein
MKKGDRPNPGEEFLYKLSGQPKFNEYLIGWRERIGVPKNGLGKVVKWQEEWDRLINNDRAAFNILVAAEHLQMKFKIPIAYAPFIRLYLCFGYIPKELNEVEVAKVCLPAHLLDPGDRDGDKEKDLRTYFPYEPYAKLIIFGTSRKSDVIKFIAERWGEVEEVFKKQGWVRPKAVRRTIYKERNLLVKELWRKSTKELQKEAGSSGTYKDLLIQKILAKREMDVKDGYIRKMRYSK